MSRIYTFMNEREDLKIITGDIYWGWNFEWVLKEPDCNINNNYGIMPLNTWCVVKSYELNMCGVWKLVKIN